MRYLASIFLSLVLFPSIALGALTDNLVSYWAFDESSGTAYDSVASNDLINGGGTYVSGKISNAIDLERTSDSVGQNMYISDGSQTGLDFSGDMSVSYWVNVESFNTGQKTYGKDASCAVGAYYGGIDSTNIITGVSDGSNYDNEVVAHSLSLATWYHVVQTYSASTQAVKVYVDGSQLGTTQTTASATLNNSSYQFNVGANNINGCGYTQAFNFFDGKIDEFGIWSRVLTSTEVSQLYASGSGLAYPFSGGGSYGFGTSTTATSTEALLLSLNLGMGIMIFLMSLMLVAWVYNSFTKKKWL